MEDWYTLKDVDSLDTPVLVVYQHRVQQNIQAMVAMVDDVSRLRPHVKTNKSIEATLLMMEAGVTKFKCATIAEAEMLAMAQAPDVLLAYQPATPKLLRLIELIKKYPATRFSCLADNRESALSISNEATKAGYTIDVYLDINVGMNRTGLPPGPEVIQLYEFCHGLPGIQIKGLHVYDGHLRDADIEQRTAKCNEAFKAIEQLKEALVNDGHQPVIIAGGSPTFPIHARRTNVECSPGTFIYWDNGYATLCPEQPFVPAALVIGRVLSLPDKQTICIDIGHKSIASENDLQKRISFLNAPGLIFKGHSEEHLVAEVPEGHAFKPGDVLYGLPYHICPTVALYERAMVATYQHITAEWKTIARDRKISV